jgi:hypothetical protein
MELSQPQRPLWQIDRLLSSLVGCEVRVAARAFAPGCPGDGRRLRFMSVADLFLPDNSQPGRAPVYFEGMLRSFERRVGVVLVVLEAPSPRALAPKVWVVLRGESAVILHGPAVVELAPRFRVEPLPPEPRNYWRDLQIPSAQFELGLPSGSPPPRS